MKQMGKAVRRRCGSSLLAGGLPLLLAGGLSVLLALLSIGAVRGGESDVEYLQRRRWSAETAVGCAVAHPRGCTIFTISAGDRVFFGGNDDWINFDMNYYWVAPGDADQHGAIFFGKPDNVQQAFNEEGLAYDSNGLPDAPVNDHPGRTPVYGGYGAYILKILKKCATIDEVIDWVNDHVWHDVMWDQMHFADATGDAVVISAGPDGRVAFTRKPPGDGFLVSTNFNVAHPGNGTRPCWRYDLAQEMLSEIDAEADLTAERATDVLDAVHVASPNGYTVMSVLGDLRQGRVYVYLFEQYDAPLVLDIAEEVARAPGPGPLLDRFPDETVQAYDRAVQRMMSRSTKWAIPGYVWLASVAVSVGVLILGSGNRRGIGYWTPVVLALGPLGLLFRSLARRARGPEALIEAAMDVAGHVFAVVGIFTAAILVPEIGNRPKLLIPLLIGLPLAFALFVSQTPLLALGARQGYAHLLLNRLPGTIVTTNVAVGSLVAVVLPTVNVQLGITGFGASSVLIWWAGAALGAGLAILLLIPYHRWALRRGYAAWSTVVNSLAAGDDARSVTSAPWRRIWPWIPASGLVLVAGAALGMVATSLLAGGG